MSEGAVSSLRNILRIEIENLIDSEEYKCYREKTEFKSAYEILKGNFLEYCKAMDHHNDPKIQTHFMKKPDFRFFLQTEIVRYIHNYLSSAKSLIDISRVHMRKINDNNFIQKCEEKISAKFASDPLSCFVQKLRNYHLHYSVPTLVSVFKFSIELESPVKTIEYRKKELLLFDGWDEKSKAYLDQFKDSIDIDKALRQYNNKVISFFDWYTNEIYKLNIDSFYKIINTKIDLVSRAEKLEYEDALPFDKTNLEIESRLMYHIKYNK